MNAGVDAERAAVTRVLVEADLLGARDKGATGFADQLRGLVACHVTAEGIARHLGDLEQCQLRRRPPDLVGVAARVVTAVRTAGAR